MLNHYKWLNDKDIDSMAISNAKRQYKASLYGKQAILVSPNNTTQTCSACGHLMKGENKLTLKDRKWTCPECGTFHIRDVNVVKNILEKGLKTLKK